MPSYIDPLQSIYKAALKNTRIVKKAKMSWKVDSVSERLERLKIGRKEEIRGNFDSLHKEILSWNYFSKSRVPPSRSYTPEPVPPTFSSVEEYRNVFTPLLMMECWQGIQKAKEENISSQVPFNLEIAKVTGYDDFATVTVSVELVELDEDLVTVGDLIVLSYDGSFSKNSYAANCLARVESITLEDYKYIDLTLKTYRPGEVINNRKERQHVYGLKVTRYV